MRVIYRAWPTEYNDDGFTVARRAGASVEVDDRDGEQVLAFLVPSPQLACDLQAVLSTYLRDCTGDELGELAGHLHCLARRKVVEEVQRDA